MQTKTQVKKVILAQPRGFCAGVNRAIDIVDMALKLYGKPIYVRHEIVHNHHVVEDFKKRGVIFIEELADVPDDAKLIFSAHGTAPELIQKAKARGLEFIDAVCPLVTKVHLEIKKALESNLKVAYIGHRGHQEVLGALGYSQNKIDSGLKTGSKDFNPQQDIFLIETQEDVLRLKEVIGLQELVVATQTTLSLNDTKEIVETLKQEFPGIQLPKSDDICYATTNRQDAVKELVKEVDIVLIIGSTTSSNTLRLLELAKSLGKEAYLVPDPDDFICDENFADKVVGISSGASAPEFLVDSLVEKLVGKRDSAQVEDLNFKEEKVFFPLPAELK